MTVDLVLSEGEVGVKDNLRRKAEAADRMFSSLVQYMNDALRVSPMARYEKRVEAPRWM